MDRLKRLSAPWRRPPFQPQPGSDVRRVIALSDCVIAVAFTLLAEEIRFPAVGLSEAQLLNFLIHSLLPDVLLYLISYLVVASSWVSHDRILSVTQRSTGVFIMLNVLLLASIVFLPVPIVLFYLYGNQATVWMLYALAQLFTSAMLLLLWIEVRTAHLLKQAISHDYLTSTTLRLLIIPLGAFISIGIALYSVVLAEVSFLLSLFLLWFLRAIYYRRRQTNSLIAGTSRICSITDNMVAVAITFLIARITAVVGANIDQSLSKALNALFAQLLVYSFSLLIVGFYWLSHHRMFTYIIWHNQPLMWLNFCFLFFIELQPILNNLRATYPRSQVAANCYAIGQACTGLMLLAIWLYAIRKRRLIPTTMTASQIFSVVNGTLIPPAIFILSLGVIYFRNDAAIYVWLLMIAWEVGGLIYAHTSTSVS